MNIDTTLLVTIKLENRCDVRSKQTLRSRFSLRNNTTNTNNTNFLTTAICQCTIYHVLHSSTFFNKHQNCCKIIRSTFYVHFNTKQAYIVICKRYKYSSSNSTYITYIKEIHVQCNIFICFIFLKSLPPSYFKQR